MCIVLSTVLTLLSLLLHIFRKRLKSVADVLQGIRDKGFTHSRLLLDGMLFCATGRLFFVMVRVVLSLPVEPWDRWIPPDLQGFFRCVFESLNLLNDFLQQVVVSRREIGIRKWTWWLREDLGRRFGSSLTSFPLHLVSLSRTLRPSLLGFCHFGSRSRLKAQGSACLHDFVVFRNRMAIVTEQMSSTGMLWIVRNLHDRLWPGKHVAGHA